MDEIIAVAILGKNNYIHTITQDDDIVKKVSPLVSGLQSGDTIMINNITIYYHGKLFNDCIGINFDNITCLKHIKCLVRHLI